VSRELVVLNSIRLSDLKAFQTRFSFCSMIFWLRMERLRRIQRSLMFDDEAHSELLLHRNCLFRRVSFIVPITALSFQVVPGGKKK
jgi:hypothetical protein